MTLDHHLAQIKHLIAEEQQAGRINSLDALHQSEQRRATISHSMHIIQQELQSVQQAIQAFPLLPERDQIRWAQSLLILPNLAFLEIDTTGLSEEDDLIRFTLLTVQGDTIDDFLITPVSRQLTRKVSEINGILPSDLKQHGIDLQDAWERIHTAVRGRYAVSYGRDWDLKMLSQVARRHELEPVTIFGDDLQRHCTRYYQEHYLTLAGMCERVGTPLPGTPEQTALDRARGQIAVVTALANAVTDLRPVQSPTPPVTLDNDDDDDHPF